MSRSIHSVLAAADELDEPGSIRLVVACDACSDRTADIARAIAQHDNRVDVIEGTWCSAGTARAAAIRGALDNIRHASALSDVWVATTDADTVVPPNWLRSHASHWSQGDDAVAGIVELLDHDADVLNAFDHHYVLSHDTHGHVHGANLGVRADAYVSVGGFPPIDLAEDHALWRALRRAGFTCRSSVALRVATSARLSGRAAGGFADTLRGIVTSAMPDPNSVATA